MCGKTGSKGELEIKAALNRGIVFRATRVEWVTEAQEVVLLVAVPRPCMVERRKAALVRLRKIEGVVPLRSERFDSGDPFENEVDHVRGSKAVAGELKSAGPSAMPQNYRPPARTSSAFDVKKGAVMNAQSWEVVKHHCIFFESSFHSPSHRE